MYVCMLHTHCMLHMYVTYTLHMFLRGQSADDDHRQQRRAIYLNRWLSIQAAKTSQYKHSFSCCVLP